MDAAWIDRGGWTLTQDRETERIYYHDHLTSSASREEALGASREFGRRMVENFTVPAYERGGPREPR